MTPEYDTDPEAIARDLRALAALLDRWLALEDPGRALSVEEIHQVSEAVEVDGEGPEVACLKGLPGRVREILAESLEIATRELRPVIAGKEEAPGGIAGAVKDAQGKIRGSLRIVKKLSGGTMPGWLQQIWDDHVGE